MFIRDDTADTNNASHKLLNDLILSLASRGDAQARVLHEKLQDLYFSEAEVEAGEATVSSGVMEHSDDYAQTLTNLARIVTYLAWSCVNDQTLMSRINALLLRSPEFTQLSQLAKLLTELGANQVDISNHPNPAGFVNALEAILEKQSPNRFSHKRGINSHLLGPLSNPEHAAKLDVIAEIIRVGRKIKVYPPQNYVMQDGDDPHRQWEIEPEDFGQRGYVRELCFRDVSKLQPLLEDFQRKYQQQTEHSYGSLNSSSAMHGKVRQNNPSDSAPASDVATCC